MFLSSDREAAAAAHKTSFAFLTLKQQQKHTAVPRDDGSVYSRGGLSVLFSENPYTSL